MKYMASLHISVEDVSSHEECVLAALEMARSSMEKMIWISVDNENNEMEQLIPVEVAGRRPSLTVIEGAGEDDL